MYTAGEEGRFLMEKLKRDDVTIDLRGLSSKTKGRVVFRTKTAFMSCSRKTHKFSQERKDLKSCLVGLASLSIVDSTLIP